MAAVLPAPLPPTAAPPSLDGHSDRRRTHGDPRDRSPRPAPQSHMARPAASPGASRAGTDSHWCCHGAWPAPTLWTVASLLGDEPPPSRAVPAALSTVGNIRGSVVLLGPYPDSMGPAAVKACFSCSAW